MSAMRNAVQRRNHKERAQPLERKKWGLLEKKKDYSLRAKDHNAKKRKIKTLQSKAAQRNEDEFYFAMMSNATRNGARIAKRGEQNSGGLDGAGKSLSVDVVKLMKTQDASYLRTMLSSTRKLRERAERAITAQEFGVPLENDGLRRRTLFDDDGKPLRLEVDDDDESDLDIDDLDMDDLASLDEDEDDLELTVNGGPLDPEQDETQRAHTIRRKQLEELREREETLIAALREVEDQQARMNGTAGGVNKNGTRFRSRSRQG